MLLGKVKLGEVTISNVTIPKIATVQTVSKAPRYAENDEPIQGSVSKIVCQFVDSELAKLIQKSGADPAELKTYLLELVGTEQDLSELSISDLIGSDVELEGAKVMLKWEQGRNGGSWRGLKVVLNISASLPETKESEKK